MIAIEASVLIDYFNPRTPEDVRIRLTSYLAELDKQRRRIIVPAPAFSEFLARSRRAGNGYQQILGMSRSIEIAPFGSRAAFECAVMIDRFKTTADKRNEGVTWAKSKFDWQIVAIAKVEGAEEILTHDRDIHSLAKRLGVASRRIDDLPLSEEFRQRPLQLPSSVRPPSA